MDIEQWERTCVLKHCLGVICFLFWGGWYGNAKEGKRSCYLCKKCIKIKYVIMALETRGI